MAKIYQPAAGRHEVHSTVDEKGLINCEYKRPTQEKNDVETLSSNLELFIKSMHASIMRNEKSVKSLTTKFEIGETQKWQQKSR